jgi:hypothetical protein
MSERDIAAEISERLNADPRIRELLMEIYPRSARYRYWDAPDGTQFHYTVEPLGDGKYASAVYVPRGKGARSGKPERLEVRREVHHRTRRAAKARAYKLYQAHLAKVAK